MQAGSVRRRAAGGGESAIAAGVFNILHPPAHPPSLPQVRLHPRDDAVGGAGVRDGDVDHDVALRHAGDGGGDAVGRGGRAGRQASLQIDVGCDKRGGQREEAVEAEKRGKEEGGGF